MRFNRYGSFVITRLFVLVEGILFCVGPGLGVCNGQLNSWTNPNSAPWEGPTNWTAGVPIASQTVLITNAGFKGVGISSVTINDPTHMSVSNLTVSAPVGALSTLLLNYLGNLVPLRILNQCEVSQNGSLQILYSACEIGTYAQSQPILSISGGNVVVSGGILVATNGTALMSGGTIFADGDCRFSHLVEQYGSINQSSGTVTGATLSLGGAYTLTNGIVSAPQIHVGESGTGTFAQYGGTNLGNVSVGYSEGFQTASGNYTLLEGVLSGGDLAVGASAACSGGFSQAGGTVSENSICVGCSFYSDPSSYNLQAGSVTTGSLSVENNGHFTQSGGNLTATNSLGVYGYFDDYGPIKSAGFVLNDGILNAGSIGMNFLGWFTQYGGTNNVTTLSYYSTSYALIGGMLSTSNTVLQPGHYYSSDSDLINTGFGQSGGLHRVAGTLTNFGSYTMVGGILQAVGIYQHGILQISNGVSNPFVSNSGLMDLSGGIMLFNTSQSLGQLRLSGDSGLDFGTAAATCQFSDCSSIPWVNSAVLTVTNWSGSTNGGGMHQLRFGNNGISLIGPQLRQIRFLNPAGFPNGTYFAVLLNSGEVVPTVRPILFTSRAGGNFVLSWTGNFVLQLAPNVQGPYVNVMGASSPFTNPVASQPRQFFRLSR